MDLEKVLPLIDPVAGKLLDIQLQAYEEFDRTHADESLRTTVERSRPKWVNERAAHLLEMAFGKAGPVRISDHNGVKYLLIEGDDFNLGIRPKKLSPEWRSYNHHSSQQDEIRRNGTLFWVEETYHLILGYMDSGGLQPAITHVVVTWETSSNVEVIKVLWTQSEGRLPIRPIQQNLKDLKPPTIRKKRGKGEGEQGSKNA